MDNINHKAKMSEAQIIVSMNKDFTLRYVDFYYGFLYGIHDPEREEDEMPKDERLIRSIKVYAEYRACRTLERLLSPKESVAYRLGKDNSLSELWLTLYGELLVELTGIAKYGDTEESGDFFSKGIKDGSVYHEQFGYQRPGSNDINRFFFRHMIRLVTNRALGKDEAYGLNIKRSDDETVFMISDDKPYNFKIKGRDYPEESGTAKSLYNEYRRFLIGTDN